ncbi:hypothetical protein LZL87_006534 [Fusarium oxysporum]|uniref:tyrosinase n=1 Tax=Fusarium oxysporum f. sp. rapae TaxID=485398 RepID=A0A8J5TNI1_FUSOX|nr:Tyrosinase [Fusarium oxysporum f. sp. rapae]KAI7764152.1 hypothetical protein LZL87_006534 [Fusarium oxysporum]
MTENTETYCIKGLPRPENAKTRTRKTEDGSGIPYVENLPVRYEISKLASSKDPMLRRQWTLFVLALEKFKMKPVNEKLSYFQVAGIHGYPEGAWDGAPAPRQDPTNPRKGDQPYGGYCNHNGLNFPTWHRPYMALFEQCIWDNMGVVLNHWATEHKLDEGEMKLWTTAKDTWRMPYWDWARQQSYNEDFAYPQVLVQGPVRIFVPEKVKEYYPPSGLYANPFWSFENPEKDEHGNPCAFGKMPKGKRDYNIEDDPVEHDNAPPRDKNDKAWMPWSEATATSRYGIFVNKTAKKFIGLEGVNNAWVANNHLANMTWYPITARQKAEDKKHNRDFYLKWNPGTLADSVNRMFSPQYNDTWGQFASTKWTYEGYGNSMNGFLSLEYIHNNVHNIVGGSDFKTGVGHMSDVPVAAFDPIFWLHHTQIDRLLAIWQSLYPKLWWDKAEPGQGNVPDETPHDLLYPFHDKSKPYPADPKEDKDFWTAEKCRDWTVFNYQYDDLMELSQKALGPKGDLNEEKFKKLLQAYIHKTYPCAEHLIRDIKENQDVHVPAGLKPNVPNISDGSWKDYIINVKYDRYALDGQSYTIKFFLGGPEDQDETHYEPQNFVGSVYTFGGGSRKTRDSCSNCKTQAEAGVLSCAQVPLTIQLLHHTIDCVRDHPIDTFDDVEDYLKLHLRWKIYGYGGFEVDEEDLEPFSKTQITVLRGIGQPHHIPAPAQVSTSELRTFSVAAADISISASSDVPANGTNGSAQGTPVALPPDYSRKPYVSLPAITNGKHLGLQNDGSYSFSASNEI